MRNNRNDSQLSLLDLLKDLRPKISDSASFNIDLQLRDAITRAIKDCPHSRYQIAAKMSELLGVEITKSMLDSWTAESKEGTYRFPACYLPAFCRALSNIEPLRIMADLLGAYVIEGEDALLTQLGKIRNQKEQLLEKERAIKTILQGMRK
jgi:hypothetical protein